MKKVKNKNIKILFKGKFRARGNKFHGQSQRFLSPIIIYSGKNGLKKLKIDRIKWKLFKIKKDKAKTCKKLKKLKTLKKYQNYPNRTK